jgi:RNA polymerase sigma-70 factor (ECF subfamily)
MLGQRQDAEDAAQETFLRVLRSLHRWDATREFEPWLLAIAGNRCRTRLGQRKRKPTWQLAEVVLPDGRPNTRPAEELAEEMNLVLAELRDEYRQAFLMFHQHQMSYVDIGEAMSCPVGTIKTWVHRARRELIDGLRRRGAIEESSDVVR